MEIIQVVVGIHEKRNHPYKYGHYDASVTFTATIDDNDDYGATRFLRAEAKKHVLQECDNWESAVREEHRIAELVNDFDSMIHNLHWDTDRRAQTCNEIVAQLPEEMQAEYHQRFMEALNQLPPKEDPGDDYPNVSCQEGEDSPSGYEAEEEEEIEF